MIEADVPDFLQYDWKGEGDDNPTARATFGIYKGNERIIYLRETTWR
jgi:MSHA biogenesis protein MshQ